MNRVTLTLGIAAMDVCWLYPWSALLGPWTMWSEPARGGAVLSAPTLIGLLLVAAFSTQVLGRRAARGTRAARIGLATLAVLAALIAVRLDHYPGGGVVAWLGPVVGALAVAVGQVTAPVVAFALGLFVWWRGVRLGSQTSSFTDVESAFRWGIGRLVLFGLLLAITARPARFSAVEAETTPFVVGFFFASMVTLALGRLESLRTRTRNIGINAQWFGVLVVIAASIVLLALVLGQLISFDILSFATRPLFDLLGQVLLLAVYAIVIPLAYIIEWLVYLVLSLVSGRTNVPPPQPPQPGDINNLWDQITRQVPPEVLFGMKAVAAAVLVALAVLIVSRALTRWRPSSPDADATNEERDSLWDAALVRARLLDWLRRMLRRTGPAADEPATAAAALAITSAPLRLSSVRELYAQLLRLGEAAGARRGSATTPLEHVPALVARLEPDESVEHLTDAYLVARYAESEVSDEETSTLRAELAAVDAKRAGT